MRSVSRVGPYDRILNIAPAGRLKVMDVGDVAFTNPRSLEQCHEDIERYYLRVMAAGVVPLTVGGLTPREVQQILRAMGGMNIIGADVVEVAPQYDATSNTAQIAAQVLFTELCLIALAPRRRR